MVQRKPPEPQAPTIDQAVYAEAPALQPEQNLAQVLVRLACGDSVLLARITARAADALGLAPGAAFAAYPEQPIKMVVAYGAGGGTDSGCRPRESQGYAYHLTINPVITATPTGARAISTLLTITNDTVEVLLHRRPREPRP